MTSIKTLAKQLNISPATVSLALNNDSRVAEKTRKRVCDLANQLGYVPNSIGRALQANKSMLLGYLVNNITVSYFSDILQYAGEAANKAGYGLLTGFTDGSADSVSKHLKMFKEKRVDGIIASSCTPEAIKLLMTINDQGIPVTLCAQRCPGDFLPAVINDNHQIGRLAAEHLIQLGRKELVYCFSDTTSERFQGALEVCMQHNNCNLICIENMTQLTERLNSPQPPTGIISYCDKVAVDVIQTVKACGLQIPNDISIVGVDNSNIASLPEYQLTTIEPPKKGMGETCIDLVLKQIKGEQVSTISLQSKLIKRQS